MPQEEGDEAIAKFTQLEKEKEAQNKAQTDDIKQISEVMLKLRDVITEEAAKISAAAAAGLPYP